MKKVIIMSLIVFIVIAIATYLFVYYKAEGLDTSNHKKSEIIFPEFNDTLHVRASSWGLTGDHIEIVVSHSQITDRRSNINTDYIYYEPTIYYKQRRDTLFIYSLSISNAPGVFNSRIKIKQVQIDDMKEFQQKYIDMGLTKVSIYD